MDDNGELLVALTDLEIARAELAAANTRLKDADEWQDRMVLAHEDLEERIAAHCEERDGALEQLAGAEAENAALSARLERVRALVDSWPQGDNRQDYRRAVTQCADAVRAALGEDA